MKCITEQQLNDSIRLKSCSTTPLNDGCELISTSDKARWDAMRRDLISIPPQSERPV